MQMSYGFFKNKKAHIFLFLQLFYLYLSFFTYLSWKPQAAPKAGCWTSCRKTVIKFSTWRQSPNTRARCWGRIPTRRNPRNARSTPLLWKRCGALVRTGRYGWRTSPAPSVRATCRRRCGKRKPRPNTCESSARLSCEPSSFWRTTTTWLRTQSCWRPALTGERGRERGGKCQGNLRGVSRPALPHKPTRPCAFVAPRSTSIKTIFEMAHLCVI